MSIFDKRNPQSVQDRLAEEQLYESVAQELANGVRREGLWVKAIAKSEGDSDKTKALYIQYRVQSIKDDMEMADAAARKQAELDRELKYQQGKKRDVELAELATDILHQKGYKLNRRNDYWLVCEPLGGKPKFTNATELYEYAVSRPGKNTISNSKDVNVKGGISKNLSGGGAGGIAKGMFDRAQKWEIIGSQIAQDCLVNGLRAGEIVKLSDITAFIKQKHSFNGNVVENGFLNQMMSYIDSGEIMNIKVEDGDMVFVHKDHINDLLKDGDRF